VAKAKLDPTLLEFRGQIGNVVYRHVRGKVVVSQAPDYSRRKRTARQKAASATFGSIARRARVLLADPKRKAAYLAKANRLKLPLISVVMSELMAENKAWR
jgi:hypothetical protein